MNEREEILENPIALAPPELEEKDQPTKVEGEAGDEVETLSGETEQADSASIAEIERTGTGDTTDPAINGENTEVALPAPVPAETALESLRRELMELRNEIMMQKKSMERIDRDCADFQSLYPDRSVLDVPDAVWNEVARGVPLPTAYLYFERRKKMAEESAKISNRENRNRSPGNVRHEENSYFSPAEVRAMTAEEVRKNYGRIMQSMTRWKK